MALKRSPNAILRPFVSQIWTSSGADASPAAPARELVLPTGAMHLVLRLCDSPPLRIFRRAEDAVGDVVGCAVIGGPRAAPYIKDISSPAPSVGALLRPGAAALIIGAPAAAFSHSHTPLEHVWGAAAVAEMRERLSAARSESSRLDLFEAFLASRLPGMRGINPLIARAVARLDGAGRVGDAVRDCGWSHRQFTKVFRETVGLGPKTYSRLMRFGRTLDRLTAEPQLAWADLAAVEGYADQAHFTREFRAFAGVSPGLYRRIAPASARHVPI
jgi:AraC-like DNA-binding protein